MVIVMNRIPVSPEYADAFEARFSDRAALVDRMPSFISFRLLRPMKEGEAPSYLFLSLPFHQQDHRGDRQIINGAE